MLKILCLITLIIFGCSRTLVRHTYTPTRVHDFNTEPELLTYIRHFEKYTGKTTKYISVKFAKKGEIKPHIGRCYKGMYGSRRILIDKDYWEHVAGKRQKVALIWHELGHCGYNLDHMNDKRFNGCPISIMNDYIPPEDCLKDYYKEYINQFLILVEGAKLGY